MFHVLKIHFIILLGYNVSQEFTVVLVLASGQSDYLDDYFTQVVADFDQKLHDAGLSKLSINNVKQTVNRTVSGVNIFGTIDYTNGLVLEVAPLELKREGHRGEPNDDGAHLFYQINFPNLTIFTDVDANLAPIGSTQGTAELLFLNTSIAIYVRLYNDAPEEEQPLDKNYTLGITTVDTKPYSTMSPATNFLPLSNVMDAAARIARLELGYILLWDQLQVWCDNLFTAMLTETINRIEFPMFPPISDDVTLLS